MTFPRISIMSYDQAEGVLRTRIGRQFTHIISINNPETEPPEPLQHHEGKHLVLSFHDISVNPNKGDFTVPGRNDVKRIIEFAESMDENSEVLCHCAAGISRSSAAALTVLASKYEVSSINAMKIIQDVLAIKNIIHPNAIMVGFADELLGWDGRLVAAHASTFKGGDLLWMPPELADLEPPE